MNAIGASIQGIDMVKRYRKKITVEAIQWTGENFRSVQQFTNNSAVKCGCRGCSAIGVPAPSGTQWAPCGAYIIKGVNGEFYLCGLDTFGKTYEQVESE